MLTLDMDGYTGLLRRRDGSWQRFNDWLKAEDLSDKLIVELTVGEGFVEAVCVKRDDNGRLVVEDDEIVHERKRFVVASPPPVEVFAPWKDIP